MARQKTPTELAGKFQQELIDLLATLNPKSTIESFAVRVHSSLISAVGLNSYGPFVFRPSNMTPENVFTKGTQFKNFAKIFNAVYDCEYVTNVSLSIEKRWKPWISPLHRNSRWFGDEKEYLYMTYNIIAKIEGMTPEAQEAIERRKREEAQKEQARLEREKKRNDHIEYYKNLNKNETYDYVGCANGWDTRDREPEIVKIADADPDHYYDSRTIGRCLTEYISHKYKFTFTVDSSD